MVKLKTIDNFLTTEDLDYLCNIELESLKKDKIKVYHNTINKVGDTNSSCINDDKIKEFQKKYHQKALDILETLYPEKVKLYDYSEFHVVKSGYEYKFPIHDDIPAKLLSGVIYLYPNENKGTVFYQNKKGDGKNEIKWKTNRAVFFSRTERETWHSFESDGKNDRLVLVYNLMTKDIKSVYKIENKSFIFGKIRSIINPYLHRYFNFII